MKTRFCCFLLGLALSITLNADDLRLWPFLYHARNPENNEQRTEIFWPLYSRQTIDQHRVHKIFSFQQTSARIAWTQYYFLWPLIGFRHGESGHDLWLFPLLWDMHLKHDRTISALVPLYFYYRDSDRKTILNVALLCHNRWDKHGHNHTLFPLLWTKQHTNGYAYTLFPLASITTSSQHNPKTGSSSTRHRRQLLPAYWGDYTSDTPPTPAQPQPRPTLSTSDYAGFFPLWHSATAAQLNLADSDHPQTATWNAKFWLFPFYRFDAFQHPLADRPASPAALAQTLHTLPEPRPGPYRHRTSLFPFYTHQYTRRLNPDSSDSGYFSRSTWLLPIWSSASQTERHSRSQWHCLFLTGAADSSRQQSETTLVSRKHRDYFWPLYCRRTRNLAPATPTDAPPSFHFSSLWLFPYYNARYRSAESTGHNTFLLLGGWGGSRANQPELQHQANNAYGYLLPFFYHQRQHEQTSTGSSSSSRTWILPYWRERTHSQNPDAHSATDLLLPFYARHLSANENTNRASATWLALAGYDYTEPAPAARQRQADLRPTPWLADRYGPSASIGSDCRYLFPFWQNQQSAHRTSLTLLPFYHLSTTYPGNDSRQRSLFLPLLLSGGSRSTAANGAHSRSLTALAGLYHRDTRTPPPATTPPLRGADNNNGRTTYLFPLFYLYNSTSHSTAWSFLPLASYEHYGHLLQTEQQENSLAIPWQWLPIYKHEKSITLKTTESVRHHLFPFYAREYDRKRDFSRFSLLYALYQYESHRGNVRAWGLGGGLSNYREEDVNGFGEQRFLYRLFRRSQRSWYREIEVMPFYAAWNRADGDYSNSLLGGLWSSSRTGQTLTRKFFYIPFRQQLPPDPAPTPAEQAQTARHHLHYALAYAESERFDLAAVEFALAGDCFKEDAPTLLRAGDAYARAKPDLIHEYFRRDLPRSLAKVATRTRLFTDSPSTSTLRQIALDYYQQALTAGADEAATLKKMAICQLDDGQTQPALKTLERRLQLLNTCTAAVDWLRIAENTDSGSDKQKEVIRRERLHTLQQHFPDCPLFLYLQFKRLPKVTLTAPAGCQHWLYQRKHFTPEHETLLRRALACHPSSPTEAPLTRRELGRNRWHFTDAFYQDEFPSHDDILAEAEEDLLQLFADAYALAEIDWTLLNESTGPQLNQSKPPIDREAIYHRMQTDCRQIIDKILALNIIRSNSTATAACHSLNTYHQLYGNDTELRRDLELLDSRTTPEAHHFANIADAIRACNVRLSRLTQWDILNPDGTATPAPVDRHGLVDLGLARAQHPTPDAIAIALCHLHNPTAVPQSVILHIGFNRTLTIALNDITLFGPASRRLPQPDSLALPLTLQPGSNTLRFTLHQAPYNTGFYARLTDSHGNPLPNP